jgi:hypothetical protein
VSGGLEVYIHSAVAFSAVRHHGGACRWMDRSIKSRSRSSVHNMYTCHHLVDRSCCSSRTVVPSIPTVYEVFNKGVGLRDGYGTQDLASGFLGHMGGHASPELSARVRADPNLTQFWAQDASCRTSDVSHCWSAEHCSASPFGRARTLCVDPLEMP